LFKIILPRWIR